MRITIYPIGQNPIDATPYLLEEEEPSFNQEFERARWEWVVDDFTVTLSDKDRTFTNAFAGITKQSKVRITIEGDVWSGTIQGATPGRRMLFRGLIETMTIKFVPTTKTVTFTAYPMQRYLWDCLKSIKARRAIPEADQRVHIGLQSFLQRELVTAHGMNSERFFAGIELGEFALRNIRDCTIVKAPTAYVIGDSGVTIPPSTPNSGMFRNINPEMTWADLLQQMSTYYNAVFYIDAETNKLAMRRRTAAIGSDVRILDDMLIEEPPIEIHPIDDQQIDYAGMYMWLRMKAPSFVAARRSTGGAGVLYGDTIYRVTAVVNDKELYVSDPLQVTAQGLGRFIYTIMIPAGPAGTQRRIIYRYQAITAELGYRAIWMMPDNIIRNYEDLVPRTSDADPPLPWPNGTSRVWFRYTSELGWEQPIIDGNGNNTPEGATQDITPQITFTDPTNESQVFPLDGQSVFEFFGSEMGTERFQSQFVDLFATKRRAACRLKETDYRLGDRVQFKKISALQGAELVVRKAKNLFYQRETEVELLEI